MQNSSIKIAFFHLAFLYSGGGEKLALKEIEYLRQKGYTVDCFAPLINDKECFPDLIKSIQPKEIFSGFSKIFRNKPEIGVLLTCLLFPFIAHKFKRYDLIIGANQPSAYLGCVLKALYRIPYIIYIAQPTRMIYPRHIDKLVGYKLKNKITLLPVIINIFRPLFFWLDLKSITLADKFLCNGPYMQQILTNIYGIKPISCPPGAYIQTRYNNPNHKNNDLKRPYILVSNRHFPHKRLELAIEALAYMKQKPHLYITGEHTDYTLELKRLANWYKIQDQVTFLGLVTEENLEHLYKNCELYMYTAPEEDFGMGIIEAMGYGKPVIAFNNAGPAKTIIHMKTGILVDPQCPNQFMVYIEKLLHNKKMATKIGIEAQKTIKKEYSWEKHIHIFEMCVQELIEQKKAKIVSNALSFQN